MKDINKYMLRISYNNISAESAYSLFSTPLKEHKVIYHHRMITSHCELTDI